MVERRFLVNKINSIHSPIDTWMDFSLNVIYYFILLLLWTGLLYMEGFVLNSSIFRWHDLQWKRIDKQMFLFFVVEIKMIKG